MYGTFAEHTENNANYSYNGRNRRSRKDTCDSATASSNIRKTQDPAGNKLEAFLYKMTNTPLKGVALGTGVTSVIQ